MTSQQFEKVLQRKVWAILILSFFAATIAIALIVFDIYNGNTGFIGEGLMGTQNCSHSYFTTKYQNIKIISNITFFSHILSALISVHLLVSAIITQCRCHKKQAKYEVSKEYFFFFAGCSVIISIPFVGYFSSFQIQLNNCNHPLNNFDRLTLLISLIYSILGLITVCIATSITNRSLSQKKYVIIQTKPTQQNQEIKPQYKNWKVDLKFNENIVIDKKIPKKVEDYTKQEIYIEKDHYDDASYQRAERQKYSSPPSFQNKKFNKQYAHPSPSLKDERLTINLHPDLKNINPTQFIEKQRSHRHSFHHNELHNQMRGQQSKYFQNMQGTILPKVAPSQRQKRYNNSNSRRDLMVQNMQNENRMKNMIRNSNFESQPKQFQDYIKNMGKDSIRSLTPPRYYNNQDEFSNQMPRQIQRYPPNFKGYPARY